MGWKQLGNKRRWAAAVLVTVAAVAGLLVWRQAEEPAPAPVPVADDPRPQLVSTRVVGRRQGDRQFELDAGAIADDGDWIRIEAIDHGMLYREGEVFVTFTARQGRWHRESNDLVLSGDVVLVYEGRVELRTDQLEWRAAQERVVSPGPVELSTGEDLIRAASMEADLADEVVYLRGDVEIERAGGGRIEMPEVVYWLAEERLEGYGPGRVRLVLGGARPGSP